MLWHPIEIKEHWGTTPRRQKADCEIVTRHTVQQTCSCPCTRTAGVYSAWHSTTDSAESLFQNTGESWLLPSLKNGTLLITTCNRVKIIHFIQKITKFYPPLPGNSDRFHSSPLWSSFQAVVLLLNCNTGFFFYMAWHPWAFQLSLEGTTAQTCLLSLLLLQRPSYCPVLSASSITHEFKGFPSPFSLPGSAAN